MQLSTKLQADYAELANQYLDSLPAENEKDFEVIVEALKSIKEPLQNHLVPPSLEGRIQQIKELIDQPELYVESDKNQDEFKKIILQRVSAKIEEIQKMSSKEKTTVIENQKKLKEKIHNNQATMKNCQPPAENSEKHVISDSDWLREQQENFQRESNSIRLPTSLSGFNIYNNPSTITLPTGLSTFDIYNNDNNQNFQLPGRLRALAISPVESITINDNYLWEL